MKRVSSTIWERLVFGPIWFVAPFVVFAGGLAGMLFVTVVAGLFLVLVDWYRYSKFQLAKVHCGDHLLIDRILVPPHDVVWVRELRLSGVRKSWPFVEFVFLRDDKEVRALCMGKPTHPFAHENTTVRLLVERLPMLREKVQLPFATGENKLIREPPRPTLNGDEPEHRAINPMARCRDPYFRRSQR